MDHSRREELEKSTRKLVRIMDLFTILIIAMVSKLIKWYTSNICSLLYVNYMSIKLFRKKKWKSWLVLQTFALLKSFYYHHTKKPHLANRRIRGHKENQSGLLQLCDWEHPGLSSTSGAVRWQQQHQWLQVRTGEKLLDQTQGKSQNESTQFFFFWCVSHSDLKIMIE